MQIIIIMVKALSCLYQLWKRKKTAFLPILLLGIGNFLIFSLLILLPDTPLEKILKKPISFFWGDEIFHYPQHLYLIGKFYDYFYIAFFSTFGLLIITWLISAIAKVYQGENLNFKDTLFLSFKKYPSLFMIWIFHLSFSFLIMKLVASWGESIYFATENKALSLTFDIAVSFVFFCLIATIFFYTYPIIVFKAHRALKAFFKGIVYLRGVFWKTFFLIVTISCFYFSLAIFRPYFLKISILKDIPELTIIYLLIYIISLFFLDSLFYSLATVIYLEREGKR